MKRPAVCRTAALFILQNKSFRLGKNENADTNMWKTHIDQCYRPSKYIGLALAGYINCRYMYTGHNLWVNLTTDLTQYPVGVTDLHFAAVCVMIKWSAAEMLNTHTHTHTHLPSPSSVSWSSRPNSSSPSPWHRSRARLPAWRLPGERTPLPADTWANPRGSSGRSSPLCLSDRGRPRRRLPRPSRPKCATRARGEGKIRREQRGLRPLRLSEAAAGVTASGDWVASHAAPAEPVWQHHCYCYSSWWMSCFHSTFILIIIIFLIIILHQVATKWWWWSGTRGREMLVSSLWLLPCVKQLWCRCVSTLTPELRCADSTWTMTATSSRSGVGVRRRPPPPQVWREQRNTQQHPVGSSTIKHRNTLLLGVKGTLHTPQCCKLIIWLLFD